MRRTARIAAVAAIVVGTGLTGGPAHAGSTGNGLLRLAHLSPDTPAVDVYVDSVAVPDAGIVMAGVGYGAVSDYQDVPPGQYTVAMREAGAQESVPPVLSTTVEIGVDTAQTVAGVGLFADLGLAVIEDELAPPQEGMARVRVLAGASNAETLDVDLQDGTVVASQLRFATTGEYVDVPAGSTGLRVAAGAGDPAVLPVDLGAGSVYSLVVLDAADGLSVEVVLDAASPGVVPRGGVETGAGGATGSGSVASLAPAALAAGTTLAGVGALVIRSARGRHRPGMQRR